MSTNDGGIESYVHSRYLPELFIIHSDRDADMAEKMATILETSTTSSKTLFAVGAGHFVEGDLNVVTLLEERGYRMERVATGGLDDIQPVTGSICMSSEVIEDGGNATTEAPKVEGEDGPEGPDAGSDPTSTSAGEKVAHWSIGAGLSVLVSLM